MGRITEKQFDEAQKFVPQESMGYLWKKTLLNTYRRQEEKDLRNGTIVSGLVALAVVGGLLIANTVNDCLTPQNVKYERQMRLEEQASKMHYGIR